MKINWFSPLPPAETGVAQYASVVLPILSRHADLTLWTDQAKWSKTIENFGTVRRYERESLPAVDLDAADLTIYHIGNNSIGHGSIHLVSLRHPGLMILHDTSLQGLFTGTYLSDWAAPAMQRFYLDEMQRYYGEHGRCEAEAHLSDSSDDDLKSAFLKSYPLTPLALEGARLALVHTEHARQDVSALGMCPTRYAPLPYAAPGQTAVEASSYDAADGPVRIAVFGHISPVRRLDALLHAISGLDERARFRLDIYGHLWDTDKVSHQIQALGLTSQVSLHGYVSDAVLEASLGRTHLAVNLRHPTLGEASYSQLQIWSHALPSLVTRNGWYAELPEDTVAFVRPGTEEVRDIQTHLRAFLQNPTEFARMGHRGRQTLDERHTPELHVQELLQAVDEMRALPPLPRSARCVIQAAPAPSQAENPVTILFDVSDLGENALFEHLSMSGSVFTQRLVQVLAADPQCRVTLCAAEFGKLALSYAQTCPGLSNLPFPHSLRSLRLARQYDLLEKKLNIAPAWSRPGWRMARKALHLRRQAISAGVQILDPTVLGRADIFQTGFAAIPAAVRHGRRVKTFLGVWGMTPAFRPEKLTEAEEIRLQRILESWTPEDHALCPSQFVKDALCDRSVLDPARVSVVRPAADLGLFHPVAERDRLTAVRHRYGIPNGPYLLGADAFGPLRNTEQVVRAFAALADQSRFSDLSLVLQASKGVGGHPIFQEIDPLGRLWRRIILTGPVDEDDLAALYSGACAFLDLSLCDGIGLQVLEAMQCGVPIVALRAGVLPERVGEAGVLVAPGDLDGICQALAEVVEDDVRRTELSALALSRAASFTWDRCVQETLQAYHTAMRE